MVSKAGPHSTWDLEAFELQPERCSKLHGTVAIRQERQEQRTGDFQTAYNLRNVCSILRLKVET